MPKTFNLAENVTITGSVYCDVKEIRENFRSMQIELIEASKLIVKKLNIKTDIKLHFRNIRRELGLYYDEKKTVEIDCKMHNMKSMINTLVHEYQHAKQYETKILQHVKSNKKLRLWNGEEIESKDHKKEFEAYQNLPWEIEARKVADELTDEILKNAKAIAKVKRAEIEKANREIENAKKKTTSKKKTKTLKQLKK